MAFRVDASANGCSGMFYRTKPEMDATSSDASWPRNGTVLQGRLSKEHSGWVELQNGYWLPVSQHGKVVTHKV